VPLLSKSHNQLVIIPPFPFELSVNDATALKHSLLVVNAAVGKNKTCALSITVLIHPLSEVMVKVTG